jgi:hypothetical protein
MTATATATAAETKPASKAEGKAETRPAAKAGVSPRHIACVCPECGAEAGYDVAPNPGPPPGGEHAPPPPPPAEVVTQPPDPPPPTGQWYLVLCTGGIHRTLWPEARLDELAPPDEVLPEGGAIKSHAPGPGGNKLFARDIPAPDPRQPAAEGRAGKPPVAAAEHPADHPHGHGHDRGHEKK